MFKEKLLVSYIWSEQVHNSMTAGLYACMFLSCLQKSCLSDRKSALFCRMLKLLALSPLIFQDSHGIKRTFLKTGVYYYEVLSAVCFHLAMNSSPLVMLKYNSSSQIHFNVPFCIACLEILTLSLYYERSMLLCKEFRKYSSIYCLIRQQYSTLQRDFAAEPTVVRQSGTGSRV